jgi:hypothetical protein
MISRLKDLIKAASNQHDALENVHIELQNLKIQLAEKGYKIITTPGKPGPHFEEDLAQDQEILPEDQDLVDYYETIRAVKKSLDDFTQNKPHNIPVGVEKELIELFGSKSIHD